jgi:hypothetical protein
MSILWGSLHLDMRGTTAEHAQGCCGVFKSMTGGLGEESSVLLEDSPGHPINELDSPSYIVSINTLVYSFA